MKLKRVSWQWLVENRVSIRHIREPVTWCDWWYVDGRFYKRAVRRFKATPLIYGFGEVNGKTL